MFHCQLSNVNFLILSGIVPLLEPDPEPGFRRVGKAGRGVVTQIQVNRIGTLLGIGLQLEPCLSLKPEITGGGLDLEIEVALMIGNGGDTLIYAGSTQPGITG